MNPEEPLPETKPSRKHKGPTNVLPHKRRRWPIIIVGVLVFILVAGGVYGALLYQKFRDAILVSGGGDSHNLLAYPGTGKTEADYAMSLKQPGDGRVNILLLGIGGVNNGVAHNGTNLTDSIQLISLDTVNKKVSTTSIPRDFLVNIPGYGPNKINAVYEYGNLTTPNGGGQAVRTMVGKIFGVNISNFIMIDFTAAQQAIDTVGGVDITVPTALNDPQYPCDDQVHYCPYSISAGLHHMSGAEALKYMRTRHADSDFARAGRQQVVLQALKAKALSKGTLSNPAKVTSLLGILGSHIKTDLTSSQIIQLVSFYQSVPSGSSTSQVLSTDASLGLIIGATNSYAGDVEEPIGGPTAYAPIQQWFAKNNPDPFTMKEAPTVTVVGGRGATTKDVTTFVQELNTYGFTATASIGLPETSVTKTELFAPQTSKPVSSNYLAYLTGTTATSGSPLQSGSNFEIVYVPSIR